MNIQFEDGSKKSFLDWYSDHVDKMKETNRRWCTPFYITALILSILHLIFSSFIILIFANLCFFLAFINTLQINYNMLNLADSTIEIIKSYEKVEKAILSEFNKMKEIENKTEKKNEGDLLDL